MLNYGALIPSVCRLEASYNVRGASHPCDDREELVVAGILDIALWCDMSLMRGRQMLVSDHHSPTKKIVVAAHALDGTCAGAPQSLLVE